MKDKPVGTNWSFPTDDRFGTQMKTTTWSGSSLRCQNNILPNLTTMFTFSIELQSLSKYSAKKSYCKYFSVR